jgi:hypothetical protein
MNINIGQLIQSNEQNNIFYFVILKYNLYKYYINY